MSQDQYLSKFIDVFNTSRSVNNKVKKYLKNRRKDLVEEFADLAAQGYSTSPQERTRFKRWVLARAEGVKPRTGELATKKEQQYFEDTMQIGFGNSMMQTVSRSGSGQELKRPIPRVPVITKGMAGQKLALTTSAPSYHELDERKYRPRNLPLNNKTRKQLWSLITGKYVSDVKNEYYKEMRDAGLSDDFIQSAMRGLEVGDYVNDESYSDIKDRIDKIINGHEGYSTRTLTEGGRELELTEGQRRLLRFNQFIASGITGLIRKGTIKAFNSVLDLILDRTDPELRDSISKVTERAYAEDFKYFSDEAIHSVKDVVVPENYATGKPMSDTTFNNFIDMMGSGGINSNMFRNWFHNTDSPFLLMKYDMSYDAHFEWLESKNRPFDICDVYSGQFFVSEEGHPFLSYNEDTPTEDMYDPGAIPSSVYEAEAAVYNKEKPGRNRTLKSFNNPRGGELRLPVFFTIEQIIKDIIEAGVPAELFKNIYLPMHTPRDHKNGWCVISSIDLRDIIEENNIEIQKPYVPRAPDVEPTRPPEYTPEELERRELRKKIRHTLVAVYGDYVFDKRDKRGRLIESKSLSEKLELTIKDKLIKIESLLGVKDAITLDRKRKLIAYRYILEKSKSGGIIDEHGLASRHMVNDFTSVLSDSANKTPAGDTIDGWMNSRTVLRTGPAGRRRVSKQMVKLRRHTYRYRVFVKGKPQTILSGPGDIIIYTKNIEYWLAQPGFKPQDVYGLLSDQIADAVGDNIQRVARIGNHLKLAGKQETVKLFKTKLKDTMQLRPTPKLKKIATRFYSAKSTGEQMRVIMGTFVKDHTYFKEVFSETFDFLVKKTKNEILGSLHEGILRHFGY